MCNLVTPTLLWSHSNLGALLPLLTLGQGSVKNGVPACSAARSSGSQQMGVDTTGKTLKVRLSLPEISLRYFLLLLFF